jgi:soluble lytic murein transglycosylase-like protein
MEILTVLLAICFVESSHRASVINISDNGSASYGYCQIKLGTAKDMGFKGNITDLWFKKQINMEYAKRYLQYQFNRYGNWEEAIAAFNSGSVKRNKLGEIVNKKYVNKVNKEFNKLTGKNIKGVLFVNN